MGQREGQGFVETHPAKLGVFGTLELRLTSPPSDNEHVISRISVLGRPRLPEDGHLLEDLCSDAKFLAKLTNQGFSWNLIAMSAKDIPDSWIERPITGAPCQEYLAVPHQ